MFDKPDFKDWIVEAIIMLQAQARTGARLGALAWINGQRLSDFFQVQDEALLKLPELQETLREATLAPPVLNRDLLQSWVRKMPQMNIYNPAAPLVEPRLYAWDVMSTPVAGSLLDKWESKSFIFFHK